MTRIWRIAPLTCAILFTSDLNQTTKLWYTEFQRGGRRGSQRVINTVLPLRTSASFAVDCTNLCCSDLERFAIAHTVGPDTQVGPYTDLQTSLVSSAQRPKQSPKTRAYAIDLTQSQVTAMLTQEGFIARRYPYHRVEVKNFNGRIEVSEKDE